MPSRKNILVVLECGDVYPSGVVRGLIYRPYFERDGFNTTFVSRAPPRLMRLLKFPPTGLKGAMQGPLGAVVKLLLALLGWLSELRIVRLARRHDIVYMSKITSHGLVAAVKKTGVRLVLDFGDAVWLPGRAVRFDDTLRLVDAVTTDNELTADYVRRTNTNCTVIPDCPDVEGFDRRRASVVKRTDRVTIGWIGYPTTVYNLFVIWEALEQVFRKHSNIHLRLAGVGPDSAIRLPPFEQVRYSSVSGYSRDEMIDEVLGMDIGLFPLQDVTASRVRGVLKATIYMAGEVAVVASPVGMSGNLIRNGANGYLARSTEDWVACLDRLITDVGHRKEIARNGLELVRRDFAVESSFRKLVAVLNPP